MAAWGLITLSAHAASPDAAAGCGRPDSLRPGGAGTPFTWSVSARAPASQAQAPRKIAVWGDSLTSAPDFIDAALASYGIARSAVLPSFIQAGINVTGLHLPLRAGCASKGWQLAYAHKEKSRATGFSRGLLSMRSDNPGDTIFMDFRAPLASTRVRQLTVLYDKATPDGSLLLGVAVDGDEETLIPLSHESGTALRIVPEQPLSTIRIRLVSGQATIHGVAPLYQDAPAAIVDTLSVPGATLRGWSNADERYFPAVPELAPDYDLILVQYGTNEGAASDFDRDKYAAYLRQNLRRLRQFYPRSRCVLIGPPDRGVVGSIGPPASLKYALVNQQIAQAQKQVGMEYRCGFWNWQAAMGGAGAAARWAAMTPPQMQQDLTHLTARGYDISGRLFARAFPLNKN